MSQRAVTQVCAEFNVVWLFIVMNYEEMFSVSNASHIVVYLLMRCASEYRHIGLHKVVVICNICYPICGFACMLDSE